MGGTARSIARRMVTGDKEPTRDLDLVYVPEFADPENPVSEEELSKIAERYMPDDYTYGHGVGTEHLKDYFGTRDFTMNQCLAVGDKLMMTRAAYDDFQENIIRPSYYESKNVNGNISNRLFLKSLLMAAALRDCTSSYPTIEEMNDGYYRWNGAGDRGIVKDFDIALVLNKAMSRGVRPALYLTELLADYGIVDDKYIDRPIKLGKDITAAGYTNFVFRPIDDNIDKVDQDFREKEGTKDDLPRVTTTVSPEVRRAMQEYESDNLKYWNEPTSGKYSQEYYDIANGVK